MMKMLISLKNHKKLVSICQISILLKLMEARIAMMRCLWLSMSQTSHQNVARNEKRTKLSPQKAPRNQDLIFSTLHRTQIHLHHPGNHLSLMRVNQIQVIFLCFASKIFTSCLYLCFWNSFNGCLDKYDMKPPNGPRICFGIDQKIMKFYLFFSSRLMIKYPYTH